MLSNNVGPTILVLNLSKRAAMLLSATLSVALKNSSAHRVPITNLPLDCSKHRGMVSDWRLILFHFAHRPSFAYLANLCWGKSEWLVLWECVIPFG